MASQDFCIEFHLWCLAEAYGTVLLYQSFSGNMSTLEDCDLLLCVDKPNADRKLSYLKSCLPSVLAVFITGILLLLCKVVQLLVSMS